MSSTVISCVVDRQPKFYLQALNWMTSLRPLRDRGTHLQIFHVGPVPDWFSTVAKEFGARISQIEPFGSGRAVYCNKLQQLEPLSRLDADTFILSDADIVFLSSPSKWGVADKVRAKIVDAPNPPEPVLKELLERAGFWSESLDCAPDWYPDSRTHRLNCNGGLYVLTKSHLEQLQGPWTTWARFCLSQERLLGQKTRNADQLGFMLAMLELGLPFEPLPVEANFPVHYRPEKYDGRDIGKIDTLHYHGRIDRDGILLTTGAAKIDRFIQRANRLLLDRGNQCFSADIRQPATLHKAAEHSTMASSASCSITNEEFAALRRKLGAATLQSRNTANHWQTILKRLGKPAIQWVHAACAAARDATLLSMPKRKPSA